MKNYYLYVLPFQEGSMFKVGISSNEEYTRIMGLHQRFKVDPKVSMLVMADQSEVKSLETSILSRFSQYSMSKKVIEVYGLIGGHREVLNVECLGMVKEFIYSQRDLKLGIEVKEGLDIPGLYGYDHYLMDKEWLSSWQVPRLTCRDLLRHLCDMLGTKQVTRVNIGIKRGERKKVQTIRYLVMAEKGFSNDLFDGRFRIFDGFVYGGLEIRHNLETGGKVQSGASFISGNISLTDAKGSSYEKDDYVEDISMLDMLLNYLNNHVRRDENYKVVYMKGSRTEQYSSFYPYQQGQVITIGKSLSSCILR